MSNPAKKFIKKVSFLGLVLGVSSLGIVVGESLTHHVVSATSAFAASTNTTGVVTQQDRYENLELFQKVLHFVEANYVDDVKNKELVYGAIKGMLETLDPHSNFLPPDVFKDMKIDTSGKFGGLGIEIGMKDNVLTVISPIEDTPAWKAGLKPNDRIVKINNESTKGMTLTEAVSKMRGKKGTSVELSIYREGFEKIKDIAVVRDEIKIQAVKSEQLENGYGYVRLASFNEQAAHDVKVAVDKLNAKYRLKGLVFDLRMNPGGLLDQAVEVASLFVDGNQASDYNGVIVSTIGRNRDQKEVKYARKGVAFKDFPVAVLVNSSTASAAEIVAGALQDYHRGIIMGQPTFGKGSVQTVIELGPDMGLKLTIARYYTPSGRSIQEKGVTPDVMLDEYDPKLLAEAKRKPEYFREKDLKGHMVNNQDDDQAGKEFKKEELETLAKEAKDGKKKGDKSGPSKDDDDMTPMKFNPKEDYQVHEALGFLKSYEVFKKIAASDKAAAGASVQKTASQ
jgi:carboxyl-terminal processing protease